MHQITVKGLIVNNNLFLTNLFKSTLRNLRTNLNLLPHSLLLDPILLQFHLPLPPFFEFQQTFRDQKFSNDKIKFITRPKFFLYLANLVPSVIYIIHFFLNSTLLSTLNGTLSS